MTSPGSVKCPDCGAWNQAPSEDTMYRCWKCQHDFLEARNAAASATAMEPAEPPPLVLALCLPMYRDITAETYECLSKFKDLPLPPGWRGMFEVPCRGQPVYLTREAIADAALHHPAVKPDVLLWVDSDCGVDDPSMLWALADRLAKAPVKVGLLAAPCRTRGFDKPTVNIDHFSTEAGQVADTWYSLDGTRDWPIPTHPDRATAEHPFVLVTKAGFGVIAMRRQVLECVTRPWFEMPWAKDPPPDATVLQRLVGEDTGFCLKARAAGFLVVADYSICAWHLEEVASRVPYPVAKPFSPAASWKRRVS